MQKFKAVLSGLALGVIGLALLGLVAFEARLGEVGGRFGGVSFRTSPGAAWLFVALQLSLAGGFLFAAVETVRGRRLRAVSGARSRLAIAAVTAGLMIVAALGVWAMADFGLASWRAVRETGGDPLEAVVTGGLLLSALGVLVFLFGAIVAAPLVRRLRPGPDRPDSSDD